MKKGFTLIELLVVVLIIGILSAIALPQYTAAVEKSRASEAIVNLKYALQTRILDHLQNGADGYSDAKDIMELSGGTWNGNDYCTDKFYYWLDDPTVVRAYRQDLSKAGCSEDGMSDYSLGLGTPFDGENWASVRECSAYTDWGYKMCKSLEGQGFEVSDERQTNLPC